MTQWLLSSMENILDCEDCSDQRNESPPNTQVKTSAKICVSAVALHTAAKAKSEFEVRIRNSGIIGGNAKLLHKARY